ncbi:MAG TPA: helix-turn-helix transcriptional regulator [Clostridiales bacterium]|nr:helix-turn-helix transcriptional regulator [Clostridiales bacterium]
MLFENFPERLYLFSGQLEAACGLSLWCFSETKKLLASTCKYEQVFLFLLETGGCLDYAVSKARIYSRPLMLSDSMGLMWIADYIGNDEDDPHVIVMGPIFSTASPIRNIEASLKKMNISVSLTSELLKNIETIPILSHYSIELFTKMLHFTIKGESISSGQFHIQELRGEIVNEKMEETINKAIHARETESIMLEQIRKGNIYFEDITNKATSYENNQYFDTGSPGRDTKNMIIIFIGCCARAAMDGGLSYEIAMDLEKIYVTKVENAITITDLINITQTMHGDFVRRVHKMKESPNLSRATKNCIAYIQANLLKRFTLEDLANFVGYTEYYLTKKFKKEIGVKLIDYIRDARLEYAKNILESTNKSIDKISESLFFSSRYYFSKVFAQKYGVPPGEYRKLYDNGEKEEK